jgi:hypothetical protein
MSNKNLGVPSVSLIDAVEAKINENRTICSGFSWGMRVIGPQTIIIDISITGSGDRFDKAKPLKT